MKDRNPTLQRALLRIAASVVLLAVSAGIAVYQRSNPEPESAGYDTKVIPPNCADSGYTLYTSRDDGSTYTDDIVPALGHDFDRWQQVEANEVITHSTRVCQVCGAWEDSFLYPEFSIPTLVLEGDLTGIGKKNEVKIQASLTGGEQDVDCFATLKYQGHSSLNNDKKNYTLKFFTDESYTEKNKLTFSHWNKENKYILKANYIDPSQCRNLICADIWADMVASREIIPEELKGLSNYGAVDGFPVALYINGSFEGLFTMNLHKDDDLFGMKDDREHAILIANTDTEEEAFFRATAQFGEDTPWEVEFCGTQEDTWAKEKLNRLITFVMESDDETFRRDLEKYLDVDSAVDYLLFVYAMGLTRHGADELVLACYGSEDPWIASVYDMETAFGLDQNGFTAASPEEFLPFLEGDVWNSATGNLLWDRLLQNFYPQIQQRYRQLRQTVLDPQRMCSRVRDYLSAIDPLLWEADHAVYPHPNPQLEHQKQITQYIPRRMELLDGILLTETGV